jgi:hypothetical protein
VDYLRMSICKMGKPRIFILNPCIWLDCSPNWSELAARHHRPLLKTINRRDSLRRAKSAVQSISFLWQLSSFPNPRTW